MLGNLPLLQEETYARRKIAQVTRVGVPVILLATHPRELGYWAIGLTPRIEEDCRLRLVNMAAGAVASASTASIVPTGGAGAVVPAAAAGGAGAGGARTARRKQRCWLFQVDGVTSNGELAGQRGLFCCESTLIELVEPALDLLLLRGKDDHICC